MNELPIITILTLLPLAGGVIALALGRNNRAWARHAAIGFGGLALVIAVGMWLGYDAASGELGFEERHAWVPSLNIEYRVAADGLGVLMLVLTALVTLMAIVASGDFWKRVEDTAAAGSGYGSPLYYALILFLQAGLFGTFTALNFFHWFIFWELSLVPAFFLIRLWGGFQRSEAATQFFVYTMVGSIALLLSFLALFLSTGEFDFTRLAELGRKGELIPALAAKLGWFDLTTQQLGALIFCGALLGFAVKVPLLPFHTWLPATYTEAPTPVTMLLTGVMSKMGVYGFVRILLPIFGGVMHWQTVRTILLGLAAATVVFSACAAFAQKDLKRILAYSSINHLGYCLLAVFAVATYQADVQAPAVEKASALNGVLLQMFNHGLTAATLFWFVGLIEKRSGGLRGLEDFGGLRKIAPVFCGLMGIAWFSSLGLPGLNGFVGEFLIFRGAFALAPWAAAFSVLGLLVTAIFILTILQRVFNGPLNEKWSAWPDLTVRERVFAAIPIALMFVLGVYPQLVLGVVNETVVGMVERMGF